MKKIKNVIAVLLAMVMVLACASCGVGKWIAKTEDGEELPVGLWNWFMYSNYYTSLSQMEDSTRSPLHQIIEDKEGAAWIYDHAKEDMDQLLALDKIAKQVNVTLTKEEHNAIVSQVKSSWDTNSQIYDMFGISQSSVVRYYEYNKLYDKVFLYYYGIGGNKGVTRQKVKAFIDGNYKNCDYISIKLSDESDTEALNAEFNEYAEQYRQGVSVEDIVAAYNAAHPEQEAVTASPLTYRSAVSLNDLNDFQKVLQTTDPGDAAVATYNSQLYLLCFHAITDVSEKYMEENETTVLDEMYGDEFITYLDEVIAEMKVTYNQSALKKYDAEWVEKTGEQ